MTTITNDDIRAELEAMNAAEEPTRFDMSRLFLGMPRTVFAVTVSYERFYEGGRGICGIYDSEQDAERVAELLNKNIRLWQETVRNMPNGEFDRLSGEEFCYSMGRWEFDVTELTINGCPVDESNLPYIQFEHGLWY